MGKSAGRRGGGNPNTSDKDGERHTYALTHPLNTASGGRETIEPYRQVEPQPDGNLLVTVLAVDR